MPKSHLSAMRRVSAYRNRIAVLLLFAFLSLGFLAAPRSFTSVLTSADAAATELFISEYIEGSSNNKAIEIYNGTGAPVNLATGNYYIQVAFNGSTSIGLTINLTGTIAPGDVYVIAHGASNPAILAQADQTSTVTASWFNGDDAIILRKGVAIIDSIGQFGVDPGTEWGSGLTSTADNTLRRKSTVCGGDPITNDAFNPATEWDGFAIDTFDGLGAHSCGDPTPEPTPDSTPTPSPTPAPFKTIPEIQGASSVSPFAGQVLMTTGIVTAKKTNGFFLQTTDADALAEGNADTSQGIFVFTSSAPAANVGDAVNVTGTVVEFNGLTEISIGSTGSVQVLGTGLPLPTVVTLTQEILDPDGSQAELERFEGMRLHADALVSVAPTNEFGETWTVLQGVPRPFREPGIEAGLPIPPDPTSGMTEPGIPVWDGNPERIIVDSDGLVGSTRIVVTSNVTFSDVTGPLDFAFGDYRITPETAPATSQNMSAVPVRAATGREFTVAGFNIENFTGTNAQLIKASLAIRNVLRLPDVIGHIEIRDLAGLQALAARVNSDVVAAGGADPQYEARLITATQSGTQHVAFLVKTSRLRIDSVTQEGADVKYDQGGGVIDDLHDRPPLVLRATVDPNGGDPRQVIVVVNHLRSFIDIEGVGGDGPRVRRKRRLQAEWVAGLLQDLQTNNAGVPVIAVGDYNAYEFSDGYTDPIGTLLGDPTPDEEIVEDGSPDVVNPNYVNLIENLPQEERYTFIFENTPQVLDHVIVNQAANSISKGIEVARGNADFPHTPAALYRSNTTRPERVSDHDMPVAYFEFPKRATTTTVQNVSVTYDINGQNVTLTANVGADINTVNEGTVTFTVTDGSGGVIGTPVTAAVTNGTATANFALPASVLPQSLTITADFSGGDTSLASSDTGTLNVSYAVCSLYDPARAVKSGGTYPIKLQLCDLNGVNLSSTSVQVKAVNVKLVSQQTTDLEVIDAGNANPDSNFRYDADLAGYIFNLKTTGLSPGVYELHFTAGNDPTVHTAVFRVK